MWMAKTHKVDIKDGDRVIRDIVRDKRKRKKEGKGRRKIRKREKLIDRQLRKYSFIYFCIIFIIKKKKEKKKVWLKLSFFVFFITYYAFFFLRIYKHLKKAF